MRMLAWSFTANSAGVAVGWAPRSSGRRWTARTICRIGVSACLRQSLSPLADLFTAEAELGRMPLSAAFARLVELEPGLLELVASQTTAKTRPPLGKLVGIVARSDNPLLHSDISASIVLQYLTTLGKQGDTEVTYFSDLRRLKQRSGSFFGGYERAQAKN